MIRPGKPPGPSRLAQAIRAAGLSHAELIEKVDPDFKGDVSAWCYHRRRIPQGYKTTLCKIIGWTLGQLEEFEREVGR